MTRVKGTAVISSLRFLEEGFGADGLRKVLAELTPEERTLVEQGLLASVWYPFSLLLDLVRSARKHFGDPRPTLIHEMGRASADHGLTTAYKIFFKFGSPEFIISRASSVFRNYYDTGEMKAVISEKGHAVVELTGFGDPAPEFCERFLGWMERTLELCGARQVKTVHDACVNRGAPACRFEGWWS